MQEKFPRIHDKASVILFLKTSNDEILLEKRHTVVVGFLSENPEFSDAGEVFCAKFDKRIQQALVGENQNLKDSEILSFGAHKLVRFCIEAVTSPPPRWEMSEVEKLEFVQALKQRGNSVMKWRGTTNVTEKEGKQEENGGGGIPPDYNLALLCHQMAVKYLKDTATLLSTNCTEDEEHAKQQQHSQTAHIKYAQSDATFRTQVRTLLVQCCNNAALCCLCVEPPLTRLGVKNCTRALQYEPRNLKALYRRAKLYLAANDFDLAATDVQRCIEIAHQLVEDNSQSQEFNAATLRDFTELAKKIAQTKKRSDSEQSVLLKQVFSKMNEASEKDRLKKNQFSIDVWSNSEADQIMSISEELEAFGEKMPPRVSVSK